MHNNFLSVLYSIDLFLGRSEVQSEGRWQWSDCHHCQELLGPVHIPEAIEGFGHGWNQDLRVRICAADTHYLYVHTHVHTA